MWLISITILFLLALGFFIYLKRRDQKYLQASVKESLGEELKDEIDQERQDYQRKQERFEKALSKAHQK